MKNFSCLFSLAGIALVLGLSACNNDLDDTKSGNDSYEAVKINATVSNTFTMRSTPLSDNTSFSEGDEIFLRGENTAPVFFSNATYKLTGGKWVPKDGKYLYWRLDVLSFTAMYPASIASVLAEGEHFEEAVPQDQSTLAKISNADLMIATLDNEPKSSTPLSFTMERLTSRMVLKILSFNQEFPAGSVVEDVKFLTRDTHVADPAREWLPLGEGDGSVNSSYTVLLPARGFDELKVSLKVNGKVMTANLGGNGMSGSSYTFNIRVGKTKLEVESTTVGGWSNTENLPDGNASYII